MEKSGVTKLVTVAVGSPFYIANPAGRNDHITAVVQGVLFDVCCWCDGLKSKEVQAWKRGWLQYGVFVRDSVPFFLLNFPEVKWSLDVTINIIAEKEDNQPYKDYLYSSSNAVMLYLIDAKSNTLKAMRQIGLDNITTDMIRSACSNQLERYQSSADVLRVINDTVQSITTEQMIKATIMVDMIRA